jgi:hypothetical protein
MDGKKRQLEKFVLSSPILLIVIVCYALTSCEVPELKQRISKSGSWSHGADSAANDFSAPIVLSSRKEGDMSIFQQDGA